MSALTGSARKNFTLIVTVRNGTYVKVAHEKQGQQTGGDYRISDRATLL